MTKFQKLTLKIALSLLVPCSFAGIIHSSAFAQTTSVSSTNSSAAAAPVQALYKALTDAQTKGKTLQQRVMIITPAVDQVFDLDGILHRSVGLRYETLKPSDKARLLSSFRRFTIARYASSFTPGDNVTFKISPTVRANPTGGQIVDTIIYNGPDNPNTIDYVMSQSNSGWRITDILLNGRISQVAAQRADFNSTLATGGAEGLATNLDQKATQFLHN
ncbi:ABC transporter substrate-binding protein [Swingsia samuiensis]|uniref:ABC transporter substrate-binding protein n=1 Tax=Swingsia samuiensis TaxID=1293412 RepID=A0A4Y6UIJ3_9PROT|nr:ABC transporter substrate-binding protein [Swingsia samuiensis]QDH16650.1 hypothetical protein E3D00_02975 [Swingsia samuiensis]